MLVDEILYVLLRWARIVVLIIVVCLLNAVLVQRLQRRLRLMIRCVFLFNFVKLANEIIVTLLLVGRINAK